MDGDFTALGQPRPVLHHSHHEEFLLCISLEFLLLMLESIASGPFTGKSMAPFLL